MLDSNLISVEFLSWRSVLLPAEMHVSLLSPYLCAVLVVLPVQFVNPFIQYGLILKKYL